LYALTESIEILLWQKAVVPMKHAIAITIIFFITIGVILSKQS